MLWRVARDVALELFVAHPRTTAEAELKRCMHGPCWLQVCYCSTHFSAIYYRSYGLDMCMWEMAMKCGEKHKLPLGARYLINAI